MNQRDNENCNRQSVYGICHHLDLFVEYFDLGCGGGQFTRKLIAQYGEVHGADGVPEMLDATQSFLPANRLHLVDIDGPFPFLDAQFDFVLVKMALMFTKDLQSVAKELRRILRDTGCCVVSVTHPTWWVQRLVEERLAPGTRPEMHILPHGYFSHGPIRTKVSVQPPMIAHFHNYTMAEYFNAFINAGLQIDRVSEPQATVEYIAAHPEDANKQLIPARLNFRAVKQAAQTDTCSI